jgi:hypothetical protein
VRHDAWGGRPRRLNLAFVGLAQRHGRDVAGDVAHVP